MNARFQKRLSNGTSYGITLVPYVLITQIPFLPTFLYELTSNPDNGIQTAER